MQEQPAYMIALSVATPFQTFWAVRALELLGGIDDDVARAVMRTLVQLQHPTGGFRGHLSTDAHLATTYGALSVLAMLHNAGYPCLEMVNRPGLYRLLTTLHNADGSYRMETDGEADLRATYCGVAAGMLGGVWSSDLANGVAVHIGRCQTYEGGISAFPGTEAHGAYTGLGVGVLQMLGVELAHVLNIPRLRRWIAHRQSAVGGYDGRTNKVVDGCYSTWLGMAHYIVCGDHPIIDEVALQRYLLCACQHPNGGLLDKPDTHRDAYHTCYDMNGLSIHQSMQGRAYGAEGNSLPPTDTRYNISKAAGEALDTWNRENIVSQ